MPAEMPAEMPAQTPPDVAAAAAAAKEVRLPTFCATDAAAWFLRAEVQFRLKKEKDESRKADYVLAALPDEVFSLITDWLAEKEENNLVYTDLKRVLLERFTLTPEQRAERLLSLSKQPLGDQRPSMALQEMKAIAKVPMSDGSAKDLPILTILWLQRLPETVRRSITSFIDKKEDELTAQADALHSAAGAATATTSQAFAVQDAATADPDELTAAASHQHQRQPHRQQRFQPPKGTTNAQRRPTPQQPQPPRGIPDAPRTAALTFCHYHKKFGSDARWCKQPCDWTKNL